MDNSVSTACSNNPCKNGGKCITDGDDYRCECELIYIGNNCEHGKSLIFKTCYDFKQNAPN